MVQHPHQATSLVSQMQLLTQFGRLERQLLAAAATNGVVGGCMTQPGLEGLTSSRFMPGCGRNTIEYSTGCGVPVSRFTWSNSFARSPRHQHPRWLCVAASARSLSSLRMLQQAWDGRRVAQKPAVCQSGTADAVDLDRAVPHDLKSRYADSEVLCHRLVTAAILLRLQISVKRQLLQRLPGAAAHMPLSFLLSSRHSSPWGFWTSPSGPWGSRTALPISHALIPTSPAVPFFLSCCSRW